MERPMKELTKEIVQFLPGTWNCTLNNGQVTAKSDAGHSALFKNESDRLHISGIYPRYNNHYVMSTSDNLPRITCAMHREPTDIACDIIRRFWPDYVRCYDLAVERIKAYTRDNELALDTMDDLKRRITNGHSWMSGDERTRQFIYPCVEGRWQTDIADSKATSHIDFKWSSRTTINIKGSLTPADARAIVELLEKRAQDVHPKGGIPF